MFRSSPGCSMIAGLMLLLALSVLPARAETPVYATPPSRIPAESPEALNDFGRKLLTEAYTIRSALKVPEGDPATAAERADPATVAAVKNLFDADALIQRAWFNFGLTRKTFFPHAFVSFALSDVAVSRASDSVLVMSYNVKLVERTSLQSGLVLSGDYMPRILVMRWNAAAGMWKIFSYADFDTPKAALCGANPEFRPKKSHFRAADIRLARTYLEKIQMASLHGTEKEVQDKGFQYVLASGERKTAPGKVRARLKHHEKMVNVEAIRSGDLLAVRFDSHSSLTMDGGDVQDALRPKLITFQHDGDGEWRLIAIGMFEVTARLAKELPCTTQKAN